MRGTPPTRKGLSKSCSWAQGPQGTQKACWMPVPRLTRHLRLRLRGTLCRKAPSKGRGQDTGPPQVEGGVPTPHGGGSVSSVRQTHQVCPHRQMPHASLPSFENHPLGNQKRRERWCPGGLSLRRWVCASDLRICLLHSGTRPLWGRGLSGAPRPTGQPLGIGWGRGEWTRVTAGASHP